MKVIKSPTHRLTRSAVCESHGCEIKARTTEAKIAARRHVREYGHTVVVLTTSGQMFEPDWNEVTP